MKAATIISRLRRAESYRLIDVLIIMGLTALVAIQVLATRTLFA